MIKYSTFFFLFFVLLFPACKKEEPVVQKESTPVFFFRGTMNGNAVSLQAGVDNYYMYSSYEKDSNGVNEFIGELKPYGCKQACASSLKVRIRNYRPSVYPTVTDSSLAVSPYVLATPSGTPSAFTLSFFAGTGMFRDTSVKHFWDFGNGASVSGDSVSFTFLRPGYYSVCYTQKKNFSVCSRTVCNKEQIGLAAADCHADFTSMPMGGGTTLMFSSMVSGGTAPYTYSWDFGDNRGVSAAANPVYTYAVPGIYRVKLKVTDAKNTSYTREYDAATFGLMGCVAKYGVRHSPVPNPLNLSSVIIEWRDARGTLYSSYSNSQHNSVNACKIISVEKYQNNQAGQAARKIQMRVSCILYAGNGTSVSLKNAEMVLAVAHP